jgi:hypothetical protein
MIERLTEMERRYGMEMNADKLRCENLKAAIPITD